MTKVRTGYEDVFIGLTYHWDNAVPNMNTIYPNGVIPEIHVLDPIPDKYHFFYNARWTSNTSPTKQIAVRKIIIFPMTFMTDIIIRFIDNN
jgi:hypothetical protein